MDENMVKNSGSKTEVEMESVSAKLSSEQELSSDLLSACFLVTSISQSANREKPWISHGFSLLFYDFFPKTTANRNILCIHKYMQPIYDLMRGFRTVRRNH